VNTTMQFRNWPTMMYHYWAEAMPVAALVRSIP
jgi:hypothetical protein